MTDLFRRFSFGPEFLFRSPLKKKKNKTPTSSAEDVRMALMRKDKGDEEKYHDNMYHHNFTADVPDFHQTALTPLFRANLDVPMMSHANVDRGSTQTLSNSRMMLAMFSSSDYLQTKRRRGGISKDQPPHHVHGFHNRLVMVQEEKAMAAVPQFPVEMQRFVTFVQERKKKRILFKGELLMIKKAYENHKQEFAMMKDVESKNNYPDVLPFDYNRVILETLPSDPHSHYINASYVDSFYLPKAYVVTQAVKTKSACIDFWRMVWELNSNCIVMLTKVFDFMKVMCLQYWPLGKFVFGDVTVETLETKNYAYFVTRNLRISKHCNGSEEHRLIRQFHFTEWEANSLPYISALLDFQRRIRQYTSTNKSEGPLIVHCSNGGERSGVFLAIDSNLELATEENLVDVYGYCKILVNARQSLVENLDQYMFIYDALSEAMQCNMEPFPLHELKSRSTLYMTKKTRQTMESQHLEEFKMLCHLTPSLRIGDCAGGHRLENRGKNRDVMVVPPDYARPYLSTLHGESKDYTYINAVYVDGFTRKNEWIVTEWPKTHTVDSFWALVFDHSCHTIVNLTSNPKSTKTFPQFIHNKGRVVYGPFIVEVINYHSYPHMTSHMIKVMKRKAMDIAREQELKREQEMKDKHKDKDGNGEQKSTFMLTDIMASSKNNNESEFKVCNIISVKMWPVQNKVPLSTSGLIDVFKMVRAWRKRAPDRPETKPTIVLSHNGVSRCGVFVAANVIIDQMDMDQECDVFHACKVVRLNRPQLIENKEEYKYLYDLVLHYYMTNSEYRNDLEKNGPVAEAHNIDSNHVAST